MIASLLNRLGLGAILKDVDLVVSLLIRMVSMVVSYGILLFVNKYFGVEIFGRYAFSNSVIYILSVIASLGIPEAIVKFNSDVNYRTLRKVDKIAGIFTAMSILAFLLIYFNAERLAIIFSDIKLTIYFKLIAMIIPLAIINKYLIEYLRSRGRNVQFSFFRFFLQNTLILVFILFLYIADYDYDYILVCYFASMLISTVLLMVVTPKNEQVKKKDKMSYSIIFKYSIAMMLVSSLQILMNGVDKIMIQYFLGSEKSGYYGVVSNLANLILISTSLIVLLNARNFSELFSEDRNRQLNKLVQNMLRTVNIINIPLFLINLLISYVLLLILGDDYLLYYTTFIIIQTANYIYCLMAGVDLLMMMTKYQKEGVLFLLLGVLLNFGLNFLLIPQLGVNGAAISTALALLTVYILSVIFCYRKMNILVFFNPFQLLQKPA